MKLKRLTCPIDRTYYSDMEERLLDIEDILGEEYDLEHLRELVQAKDDGRVRILPKSEDETCGSCGHFKRIPGRNCGMCEVRPYYTDRRGHIDTHRGTFTPSQSRKCCKQYILREDAEATLKGGDEG